MIAGIIGNTNKLKGSQFIFDLVSCLNDAEIESILSDSLIPVLSDYQFKSPYHYSFGNLEQIGKNCDFIISAGGDGTLLASAITAFEHNKPIVGVNLGKLGFLAEVRTDQISNFIAELQSASYVIEERVVLEGKIEGEPNLSLLAFNDIVIDKGGWPKMIEIKLSVGKAYVNSFSSDGLIIATPAGSTGYSLSVGGPIVTPDADVITLSPISAHSLSMRPLVINSHKIIQVEVTSPHNKLHINCDGQRVHEFTPPVTMTVTKNPKPLKLLRSDSFDYFDILRNKLYWGMDFRTINNKLKDRS